MILSPSLVGMPCQRSSHSFSMDISAVSGPKYLSPFQQQYFPFSMHPLWEQRGCSEGEGARLPAVPFSGAGGVHNPGLKY